MPKIRNAIVLVCAALALSACGRNNVVYMQAPAPQEKKFGDAPRPALAAAIGGVSSATPTRDQVGSSWVKRHLVLEQKLAPALIAASPPPAAAPPSPVSAYASSPRRQAIPSLLLSPDQFDPNRVF